MQIWITYRCSGELNSRDQCRDILLTQGARNTTFYHTMLKIRKYQRVLYSLLINDALCNDKSIMNEHVIQFYNGLFNKDPMALPNDLSGLQNIIPYVISDFDNVALIKTSLDLEVQ